MTEGNGEVREFPKGWIEVALSELFLDPTSEIVDGPFGSNLKASEYQNEGIPIIRLQNIDRNKFIKKNINYVTLSKAQDLKRHSYKVGDIIITKLGDPLGKACIVPESFQAGVIVADLVRVRINHNFISKQFLVYSINSIHIANQLKEKTKGTTRPRVNLNHIRNLQIFLPPLLEQYRIVDKVEELFSDLDQGIESLKIAQKQLKVYSQAVLKWAFEGKLTEAWRKQQSTLKTGEALLAQIKTKRENRYQQRLAEWETAVKEWEAIGKIGKKSTKPRKPKEPTLFTKSERFLIPSSWYLANLEDITDDIFDGPFGSNLKTEDYVNEGIRVVRLENIEHLNFDNSKKIFISEEKYRTLEKHTVYKGDIIFSSFINEEIRATILPDLDTKTIAKADCFCIRNKNGLINQKWLVYLLSSRNSYNQLIIETHGFTRPRINSTQLKQLIVPLCPPAEQEQIVEEIESRLSICDQLEATIIENLQKAEALRQSILKQAFEGKLVPQDPNDEPAETLLDRIRAERQVNGNTGKKSKPSHQQLTLQEL